MRPRPAKSQVFLVGPSCQESEEANSVRAIYERGMLRSPLAPAWLSLAPAYACSRVYFLLSSQFNAAKAQEETARKSAQQVGRRSGFILLAFLSLHTA